MTFGKTPARSFELHLRCTTVLEVLNTHLQLVEGSSDPIEVYSDVFECFVISWAFRVTREACNSGLNFIQRVIDRVFPDG
jgi:hypothetical protein